MCGGGGVEDNSDEVARIEAAAAEKKRQEDAAERARQEALFSERLGGAYNSAVKQASDYFTSMGLDPNQFMDAINSEAGSLRGAVPMLDASPATYFAGLGEKVYNNQQSAARSKALRDIEKFAGVGFEKNLIGDSADDPILAALLEDNYGDASSKITAQKNRGILTDAGFAAAMAELGKQKTRAKYDLDTIGSATLGEGRTKLLNQASEGKSKASQLMLGQNFDPYSIEQGLNSSAQDFIAALGDKLRATAPTNLFDILKAQTVGGIGQGAQNTPYDKDASQGLFDLFAMNDEAKKKKKKDDTPFASAF